MSNRFRDEVEDYLKTWRGSLQPGDQDHLERWIRYIDELGNANNSAWNVIADEAAIIIRLVLDARRMAENAELGDLERHREQEIREEMLRAADSADALAQFLLNGIVHLPTRVVLAISIKQHLQINQGDLAKLHEREAEVLRALAPIVHPSRIRRQKMKKSDCWSRGQLAFMRWMSELISHFFGRKYDEAVAEMTNVAFDLQEDKIANAEDVRSACRPSTRTARKRKGSGTLNR